MKRFIMLFACMTIFTQLAFTAADVKEDKRLKIAVIDFQNQTGDALNDSLVKGISDTLIDNLQKSGAYRLIERKRLEAVLSELKLSMDGLVDSSNAKQLGNQLGVDALVFGNLSSVKYTTGKSTIFIMWTESQKTEVNLNARIVNVETGEIIKTSKVSSDVGNRKWVAFGFAKLGRITDKNAVILTGIEEGCKKLAKQLSK